MARLGRQMPQARSERALAFRARCRHVSVFQGCLDVAWWTVAVALAAFLKTVVLSSLTAPQAVASRVSAAATFPLSQAVLLESHRQEAES